jgi:integral membrane protein
MGQRLVARHRVLAISYKSSSAGRIGKHTRGAPTRHDWGASLGPDGRCLGPSLKQLAYSSRDRTTLPAAMVNPESTVRGGRGPSASSDPVSEAARGGALASEKPRRSLERLRRVGKLEAVSFLVLLGIAMPLKYIAHWPLAVKLCGWVHGVLFVWFVISLWRARRDAPLSIGQALTIFIAALLPFGPFLIDRRLAREAASRAPS